MPKLKNLKHELLANNIVKEKFNLTQAYQDTYPNASYDSANSQVHTLVKQSPNILSRAQEVANKKGLTLEFSIDSLLEIHNANKPISFNGKVLDEYPDYATRLEATKTGLKIHGVLSENQINNIDARQVNVELGSQDVSRLENIVSAMQALRQSAATPNAITNANESPLKNPQVPIDNSSNASAALPDAAKP